MAQKAARHLTLKIKLILDIIMIIRGSDELDSLITLYDLEFKFCQ